MYSRIIHPERRVKIRSASKGEGRVLSQGARRRLWNKPYELAIRTYLAHQDIILHLVAGDAIWIVPSLPSQFHTV